MIPYVLLLDSLSKAEEESETNVCCPASMPFARGKIPLVSVSCAHEMSLMMGTLAAPKVLPSVVIPVRGPRGRKKSMKRMHLKV